MSAFSRDAWDEADPAVRFRRRALQAILTVSVLTAILTLLVSLGLTWDPKDRGGLAFLAVWNALLLTLVTFRPASLPSVSVAYFMVGAVTGLLKFATSLLVDTPAVGLGSFTYWLPFSYVAAFLVLGRWALPASALLYAAYLAVAAAYFLSPDVPGQVKHENASAFVQVLLSHAAFISVFTLFGHLLRTYVRDLAVARTEAQEAYLDVLTGLPNRRQLMAWLASAMAGRQGVSVIAFDLDHFKQVNDRFGHDVGDEVLRLTGRAVSEALRRDELFGRWGGEEFVVLLPGANARQAAGVAERVREAIAAQDFPFVGQVTASFGVVGSHAGETPEALLRRADEALYAAKRAGRARVELGS